LVPKNPDVTIKPQFAVAAWFLCLVGLKGDLASTKFLGTNAFPIESTGIRLEKADVRIFWGNLCTLNADFTLNNESENELVTEVGFPGGGRTTRIREGQSGTRRTRTSSLSWNTSTHRSFLSHSTAIRCRPNVDVLMNDILPHRFERCVAGCLCEVARFAKGIPDEANLKTVE
jgi:hypothetical protein